MLKFGKNVRLRSGDSAYSVDEQGNRIDYPVPKLLVFDAATEPLSTTIVVETAEALTAACRNAFRRQLVLWLCFVVIVLAVAKLVSDLSVWFAVLIPLVMFFTREDLMNLPTGKYMDLSGNVVSVRGSYITTPSGATVQMHTKVE